MKTPAKAQTSLDRVAEDHRKKAAICAQRGHDWMEYIDRKSGGFMGCLRCGITIDCEDPDGDLG